MRDDPCIVAAVRTPVGRRGGALATARPDDLGAHVLRALIERANVDPSDVEDVSFGCANGAGEDNRNVARMSWLIAGLPVEVSAATVNRLCGSGLEAVAQGARAIAAGEGNVYVGGGVESMSRAPWAVPKAERGFPSGPVTMYDTALGWRFVNPEMERLGHTDSLGQTAENLTAERIPLYADGGYRPERLAREYDLSRATQDRFALASHEKAVAAADAGRFAGEIAPVEVHTGSRTAQVRDDEGPRRDTTLERLGALRPAFASTGTVTAGNSSPLNDGAAALLLTSGDYAHEHGLQPLARIRSVATAGVPPRVMGLGPIPATEKALGRAGLSLSDIGLIELNEAFAAQALAVLHEWDVDADDDRLNVNGGAIALGHPLGCSGARILTTLVHEMQRRPEAEFALATMCIGVGQGIAMVLERSE